VTPAERKLASKMLDMASDEFSNHGCNDFDLVTDGGMTVKEADAFQRAFYKWNGTPDDYRPGETGLADSVVMNFLSHLLKSDS